MSSTLHPRILEVLAELGHAQQAMEEVVALCPPTQTDTVVRDGVWSMAQIVEHLLLVEDGTGRLLSTLIKQCEGTTDSSEEPILPTLAKYAVADPVAHPIVAPDSVTPRGVMSFSDALAAQQVARERVVAALGKGSGRALADVSHPHPILGPLNAYQWAHFIALHQHRHLVQMRALLAEVAV